MLHIGRKVITIKKSMVPFAMEGQLFGTRYKTLDSSFEGNIELRSRVCFGI